VAADGSKRVATWAGTKRVIVNGSKQSTVDSAIEETATGSCFLYWGPEGSLEDIVKSIAAVLMRRTEARRAAS
jgi:hypothetical protein